MGEAPPVHSVLILLNIAAPWIVLLLLFFVRAVVRRVVNN